MFKWSLRVERSSRWAAWVVYSFSLLKNTDFMEPYACTFSQTHPHRPLALHHWFLSFLVMCYEFYWNMLTPNGENFQQCPSAGQIKRHLRTLKQSHEVVSWSVSNCLEGFPTYAEHLLALFPFLLITNHFSFSLRLLVFTWIWTLTSSIFFSIQSSFLHCVPSTPTLSLNMVW